MRLITVLLLVACGQGKSEAVSGSGDTGGTSLTGTSVTGTSTTDSGDPTGAGGWSHTATVDGDVSEYSADETWATTGGSVHITWDATTLYVASSHPDAETGGELHWLMVYVGDGSTGTTEGATMNSQQPTLPVPMSHVARRKADGSYDDLLAWSGTEWASTAGWLSGGPGQVAEAGQAVELAIPLADIATEQLVVHVAWLYEGTGYESTYSGAPAASFVDGYDPDYSAVFTFDLLSADAPAVQQP